MSDRPPRRFLDRPEYSACIILQLGGTEGDRGGPCRERLDDITLMSGISKTAKIDFTATFLGHGREVSVSSREFPRNFFIARGALSFINEPDILFITDVTRVISDIEFA